MALDVTRLCGDTTRERAGTLVSGDGFHTRVLRRIIEFMLVYIHIYELMDELRVDAF